MVRILLIDKKEFRKSMAIEQYMPQVSMSIQPEIPITATSLHPLNFTVITFNFSGRQTRSGKLIYREE